MKHGERTPRATDTAGRAVTASLFNLVNVLILNGMVPGAQT